MFHSSGSDKLIWPTTFPILSCFSASKFVILKACCATTVTWTRGARYLLDARRSLVLVFWGTKAKEDNKDDSGRAEEEGLSSQLEER